LVLRAAVWNQYIPEWADQGSKVGRPMEEMLEIYSELRKVLINVTCGVLCGVLNGHVGASADGFSGI